MSTVLERSRFYRSLSIPAMLLLTLLFLVPLVIILSKAFVAGDGGISFDQVTRTVGDHYTWHVLGFTVLQALASTAASVIIALPGAYLLANYRFRGKRIIRAICTVPFVLPSILVVLGFVIFYGNNGLVNRMLMRLFGLSSPPLNILYTFGAIILAHAFYNFPIALGLVSSYWEQLPTNCEHAAMTMGARRSTVFRTVTLPRLIPAILSASTLIFLYCFSSFAILLVLGGGPRFTTVEVEIYRRARMTMDVPGAAALSMLSIVIQLVLVAIYSYTQRMMARQEEVQSQKSRLERRAASWREKTLIVVYVVFSIIFVLGPLAGIIYRSLLAPVTRSGELAFSMRWYRQLFGFEEQAVSTMGAAGVSIVNSLAIALLTTVISVAVGTLMAARLRTGHGRGRFSLELFAMLPMAVSSVVIGLGYYLISATTGSSRMLVVLAHVVITSPFVLRTILPEYRKIPFSYTQASLTLGATVPQTFWKIELPLLRGALVTGAAFAFAISMGEMNATLVLADSSLVTVPIVMYRLIGSYNYAGACALGTVLIACCAVVFVIIESLKKES